MFTRYCENRKRIIYSETPDSYIIRDLNFHEVEHDGGKNEKEDL